MHHLLSGRQLEKARSTPLNKHCRYLLQKAGCRVDLTTLGATELMLWGLQQELDLDLTAQARLKDMVEMLQGKPNFVLRLLEGLEDDQQPAEVKEVLETENPLLAARILLELLQKKMHEYQGGSD